VDEKKKMTYLRRLLDARRVVRFAVARLLPRARLLLLFRAELDAARLFVVFRAAILHLLFLFFNY